MKINRKKIEARFPHIKNEAIMHALLGAILYDNPTGCALLGQRNEDQAVSAGKLGKEISKEDEQVMKKLINLHSIMRLLNKLRLRRL